MEIVDEFCEAVADKWPGRYSPWQFWHSEDPSLSLVTDGNAHRNSMFERCPHQCRLLCLKQDGVLTCHLCWLHASLASQLTMHLWMETNLAGLAVCC